MQSKVYKQLRAIVGMARVSATGADRQLHAQDASDYEAVLPDVVIWPQNTQEVSDVVALANRHKVPVTAWGAGTSLEGNSIPVQQGIVMDFSHMDQIVSCHPEDLQITVQPGLKYKDMNRELAQYGLFFAPDPGANASIGGMISTNAAGPRTVKYGATNDNLLALEVVLANGEVLKTGSRSVKQASGYNLKQLFAGSEGTLGLITQATLKLDPIPKVKRTATAVFPSIMVLATAVAEVIGNGVQPAALELLDESVTQTLAEGANIDLEAGATLLIEFSGNTNNWMNKQVDLIREMTRNGGASHFRANFTDEECDRLWQTRKQLRRLSSRKFPNHVWLLNDVSVPNSAFPEMVSYTVKTRDKLNVQCNILGHAGDGNLLIGTYFLPEDEEAEEEARRFKQMIISRAIRLGGTCTGEYGIGLGKRPYMMQEHGYQALNVMRQIKKTLDPNNILNPGKIIPD